VNDTDKNYHDIVLRRLQLRDYLPVWHEMQRFTAQRDTDTHDEIWLLQHPPVFTLGLNGKRVHLLNPGDIPVVICDRGGQVTYHGPGQIVVYLLLDLRRRRLGVRDLVTRLEQAVIDLLTSHNLSAARRAGAPGVYVDNAKIAALGLRVRRGCCYHGLSLNVNMDLEPFTRIDPCGHHGLVITQLSALLTAPAPDVIADALLGAIRAQLDR
jgi:lipoyl(octanoyl) transferase